MGPIERGGAPVVTLFSYRAHAHGGDHGFSPPRDESVGGARRQQNRVQATLSWTMRTDSTCCSGTTWRECRSGTYMSNLKPGGVGTRSSHTIALLSTMNSRNSTGNRFRCSPWYIPSTRPPDAPSRFTPALSSKAEVGSRLLAEMNTN